MFTLESGIDLNVGSKEEISTRHTISSSCDLFITIRLPFEGNSFLDRLQQEVRLSVVVRNTTQVAEIVGKNRTSYPRSSFNSVLDKLPSDYFLVHFRQRHPIGLMCMSKYSLP